MSKTNAKKEFIGHIQNKKVKCVRLSKGDKIIRDRAISIVDWDESVFEYELGCGYNKDEWNEFLNKLDFEYDSGYGSQELFGIIWYEDGTWSDRGEYDGSEWYEYHMCPEVPSELKRIDRARDNKINEIIKND